MIQFLKKSVLASMLFGFIGLFFMSSKLNAQQDTIYYNAQWKETVRDSMAFFRPPVKKEGDLYRIEDFYASGQIQMSGLSKEKNKTRWEGQVSWYHEDGKLYQQGEYKDNKLNGEFITFLNGKKLMAIYENGYYVAGKMNRNNYNNRYYSEIKNDTIREVVYDKDINGIRYENYRALNSVRHLSKYYNEKGELIAELKNLKSGYSKGAEVYYYYNPMRVKQIRYYPYERLLGESVYYENGQIRTEFQLEPEFKRTFYKKDGTKLGSLTYNLVNDYLKPETGTEYVFSYSYKEEEANIITNIRVYKASVLQKEEILYPNGKVKVLATYKDNGKELQISYDENGKEIARMTYDGYYPLTGTEMINDRVSTYLEGELIKEINYYPKTKQVFSERTPDLETFYNKEGDTIGTLEVLYENKYSKPMNGKRFFIGHNTEFSSIQTYENGYLIEQTVFRAKAISETKSLEFKTKEYFNEDGYNKIREVIYYSNGNKQSDIEYEGYNKKAGKFYNEKGELMGSYDFVKKDGIAYEFFNESNVIREMREDNNGELVRLKRYDYGEYRRFGDVNAILIEEVDVNCCSKSYKRDGEVFAEAIFKDGKPWSGTIYDNDSRSKFTVKEGKRNGVYKNYDYDQESIVEEGQFINDKKEGLFSAYNRAGELESTMIYKNDQLNGEAIYYDKNGNETSSLIYKNDLPFQGTKIISEGYNREPTEETYNNGTLVKRVSYDEKGRNVTTLKNGVKETIVYHKDSDKMRLSYSVGDYYINGEVIKYDKNGKEEHKAIFKNNKLESGVVYLNGRDTYDDRVAYVIVNKTADKLSVTYKDKDDAIIFFAEEVMEKGYSSKYIYKLNLYIDNLNPRSLY